MINIFLSYLFERISIDEDNFPPPAPNPAARSVRLALTGSDSPAQPRRRNTKDFNVLVDAFQGNRTLTQEENLDNVSRDVICAKALAEAMFVDGIGPVSPARTETIRLLGKDPDSLKPLIS